MSQSQTAKIQVTTQPETGKSRSNLTGTRSKSNIPSALPSGQTLESSVDDKSRKARSSAWVERNSQPRVYHCQRIRRDTTRWQKRGPMSKRDWARFYSWAAENATPRLDIRALLAKKEEKKRAKSGQSRKPKIHSSSTIKRVNKDIAELFEYMSKLSTPLTRKKRDKYQYPPIPDYPFSPQINVKNSPKKDCCRPFKVPKVPKCFQHIELELDWWYKLRFPVSKPALKCTPTRKMQELAKPRITPPLKQHCVIPEKPPEVIPKRQRMDSHQWREHLLRLRYLAKPKNRMGPGY